MAKHRVHRGWRYRGEHFDKSLTVAYLVEKCKPTPMQRHMQLLRRVSDMISFYGLVSEPTPETVTATLELVPSEPTATLPAYGYPYLPYRWGLHPAAGNAYTIDSLRAMNGSVSRDPRSN